MLQDNPWTGLFFMVGIFFGSLAMGIAAILAVMTETIMAILLRYDVAEINSGIYAFSAALVGLALTVIFSAHNDYLVRCGGGVCLSGHYSAYLP